MSRAAYEKFKRGERLTRGQAIRAQCYECNGLAPFQAMIALVLAAPYMNGLPGVKVVF